MHIMRKALFILFASSFMFFMTADTITESQIVKVPEAEDKSISRRMSYQSLTKFERNQIDCLTENIYREAGHEPRIGWIAVAFVTMNRLSSGNYADSVCRVVYQKIGGVYQFSWVGHKNLPKIDRNLYSKIREVATTVYIDYNASQDVTHGATYYHADYVHPRWSNLQKTKKIGTHIFYRSNKDTDI